MATQDKGRGARRSTKDSRRAIRGIGGVDSASTDELTERISPLKLAALLVEHKGRIPYAVLKAAAGSQRWKAQSEARPRRTPAASKASAPAKSLAQIVDDPKARHLIGMSEWMALHVAELPTKLKGPALQEVIRLSEGKMSTNSPAGQAVWCRLWDEEIKADRDALNKTGLNGRRLTNAVAAGALLLVVQNELCSPEAMPTDQHVQAACAVVESASNATSVIQSL